MSSDKIVCNFEGHVVHNFKTCVSQTSCRYVVFLALQIFYGFELPNYNVIYVQFMCFIAQKYSSYF